MPKIIIHMVYIAIQSLFLPFLLLVWMSIDMYQICTTYRICTRFLNEDFVRLLFQIPLWVTISSLLQVDIFIPQLDKRNWGKGILTRLQILENPLSQNKTSDLKMGEED